MADEKKGKDVTPKAPADAVKESILGKIGDAGGWVGGGLAIIELIRRGWDIYDKLPEPFKQRMPGLFGLSLVDERIFNEVMALLDPADQALIGRFLYEKCKDFQRNRFINIVAGLEVTPETPKAVERKSDPKTGKVVSEKITDSVPGVDRRQKFLEQFAKLIRDKFGGDFSKAYEHCIGGRVVLQDPYYQKVLDLWVKSCTLYQKILTHFGVADTVGLFALAAGNVDAGSKQFEQSGISFLKRCLTFNQWK